MRPGDPAADRRGARPPRIIAHRGFAAEFPENTLRAIAEAIAAGAMHVEFDVQLSADRIAVLAHDETLERTGGVDTVVSARIAAELATIPVGEPARFGNRFDSECVALLDDALRLAARHPSVTVYPEIKRAALRAFGRRRVLAALMPVLAGHCGDYVLISFDRRVLELARAAGVTRIGWVLERYDDPARRDALALAPDLLLCNDRKLPAAGPLWPGPWEWAVYEVVDPAHAWRLAERGVAFVETMAVAHMIAALAEPRG